MQSDAIADSILTTRRQLRLTWYEDQIRKRLHGLGALFMELRDDREQPWAVGHETFEAYCEAVWGMTKRRLQQIATGDATRAMLTDVSIPAGVAAMAAQMPEGQLRPLAGLPVGQAVQVVQQAARISSTTGAKLTANTIRAAKARVVDPSGTPGAASEQLEFSFQITAPPADVEWFKSLSREQRGLVISEARQRAASQPASTHPS